MEKILLIDDDPNVLTVLEKLLKKTGYTVDTAANGKEGLSRLEAVTPDLIITDLIMPDMGGIEFLRSLRKVEKSVPVIVMSGHPVGMKYTETARLLGAKSFLKKPFTSGELISSVESSLGDATQ